MLISCPNCQSNLGLEEIDFNQCDTCGCTFDDKGNITGVVDTDDEDDDDLIGYDEDPEEGSFSRSDDDDFDDDDFFLVMYWFIPKSTIVDRMLVRAKNDATTFQMNLFGNHIKNL